ncbi:MAG: agmatinase [Nitrospirota bacterium]
MLLEPVKPFSESKRTYETAEIIILGIPLDVTVSFRPGTRFAPSAIREISWHLEDYNYLTDEDILDVPFFDMGDLCLTENLDNNLIEIRSVIKRILDDRKIPLSIGGEHLITFPIIQALSEIYHELHIIALDAHTDMSDEYRNIQLSHANVMKLVYDIVGRKRLFMFGTRSGTKEDKQFMAGNIFSSYKPPEAFTIEKLRDKPVYISIDMDVLDPSIAPGVTTPEPLGWKYEELYETIKKFSGFKKIVGTDITELCPHYDPTGITSLIGAKAAREIMFLLNRCLKNA